MASNNNYSNTYGRAIEISVHVFVYPYDALRFMLCGKMDKHSRVKIY